MSDWCEVNAKSCIAMYRIFLLTIVQKKYLYIFAIYLRNVRIYNSETFFN